MNKQVNELMENPLPQLHNAINEKDNTNNNSGHNGIVAVPVPFVHSG